MTIFANINGITKIGVLFFCAVPLFMVSDVSTSLMMYPCEPSLSYYNCFVVTQLQSLQLLPFFHYYHLPHSLLSPLKYNSILANSILFTYLHSLIDDNHIGTLPHSPSPKHPWLFLSILSLLFVLSSIVYNRNDSLYNTILSQVSYSACLFAAKQ